MGIKYTVALIQILTIISIFEITSRAQATSVHEQDIAGLWWIKATPDEKMALLTGEESCFTSRRAKKVYVDPPSILVSIGDSYYGKIDTFLVSNPQYVDRPITETIRSVVHYHLVPTRQDKLDESRGYSPGHIGIRQWLAYSKQERISYISGYLACSRTYRDIHVNMTPQEIEVRVSKRMGVMNLYSRDDANPKLPRSAWELKADDQIEAIIKPVRQ